MPAAGEVLLELGGGHVRACGGAQDARADLVGEGLEHGIVAFASMGHAYQARLGRGDRQRAYRAVDGAVGDVQDAVLLGRGG